MLHRVQKKTRNADSSKKIVMACTVYSPYCTPRSTMMTLTQSLKKKSSLEKTHVRHDTHTRHKSYFTINITKIVFKNIAKASIRLRWTGQVPWEGLGQPFTTSTNIVKTERDVK